MAFDISTSRPEQAQPDQIIQPTDRLAAQPQQQLPVSQQPAGGFDISTAQPVQPQQQPDFTGAGIIEPALAVGSAAGRAVAGGVAGIFQALNPLAEEGAGAETVREFQQGAFQPETQAGKEGLEALGGLVQKGIDIANFPISGIVGLVELVSGQGLDQAVETIKSTQEKGISTTAGRRVFEETGSPLAATIAETAPEAALSLLGFGPAVAGTTAAARGATRVATRGVQTAAEAISSIRRPQLVDVNTGLPTPAFSRALESKGLTVDNLIDGIPDLPSDVTPKQAVNLVIKDKLIAGARDDALAPFNLSRIGAVQDDIIANEALRQGFQRGDVQAAKTASNATKVGMRDMLKKTRQIKANSSLANEFRPTDVIGTSVLKRFTHIRESANTARLELDNIAKTRLEFVAINADGVRNNFLSEMDRLDVGVDTSTIPPKLDFEGSLISKDRTSQRVIKDVVDLLSEPRAPDALRAHKLKRQLDNLIDFRKKAVGGLTEAGRNVAKSIRKSLNDSIREVSDEYAAVNDILSESIGTLDEFQRVLGPSIDVFKEGAEKAIGQDLKGLISNRKSRVRLENSVNSLDKTAKNLGGQFDDDVADLVSFAEVLDDKFGVIAKGGFKGQAASAFKQAAEGREGIKAAVIERGAEAVEKARGINEQNAFKAMQELLRGQQ